MIAEPLISIVEDDTSLQNALVRLLRSVGYNAKGFISAEEFVGADLLNDCSCVITDIQMSGMSGLDLTNLLSRHNPPVPVIVITAGVDQGVRDAAFANGALCFLNKPVDTSVLLECIKTALAF